MGAAKLALKVGSDAYFNSLKALEFGSKSGSGFPGEISGVLPPRKSWQPLTLANIGFGQGILVTPIQMLRAYASFLNGGWLVQPKLIHEDNALAAEKPKRIFTEKVSNLMLENLEGPLKEGGTAIKANLAGYKVAGKTGTAQKVDPHTHAYSRSKYVASFIGMPLNVEPKVVIFASVDEPKGVYYASETAAPLFREVLNAVVSRYSMPSRPDIKNSVLADSKKSATSIVDRINVTSAHPVAATPAGPAPVKPLPMNVNVMPSLRGLTAREVLHALEGRKIHLEISGAGRVHSQTPAEGATFQNGETIHVHMSEE